MYRNQRLAVFYHRAHMGTWQAVDAEIMAALRDSGLLANVELFVQNDCTDVTLYEFPTIHLLQAFAATNNATVLYLHTKGVTRPCASIDDWRACMLYWMVERWRECIDKIRQGAEVVGISHIDTPLPHFQGNFWWARTSHLRTLAAVESIQFTKSVANQGERHKAEFWVLSKPAKHYQPYHHRLNPYTTRNPRSAYVGKRF